MSLIPTAITPTSARDRLEDYGLASLGMTMPLLSPTWSPIGVTFNESALTLTMPGPVLAPVTCLRMWVAELAMFGVSGVDGLPFVGPGAIVRLHPQAAQRLERLLVSHLGAAAADIRPVPTTIVIRDAVDNVTATWFEPGQPLSVSGLVSFHDDRGLIIDPVAVAGEFASLSQALPGLGAAPSNAMGGLADIAGKGLAGVFVHVVDPHGAPFQPSDGTAPQIDNAGTPVGPLPASSLVPLAAGHGIAIPPEAAARLRIGWSRNHTLGRDPIVPPAVGPALHRQFLRATAVDLRWHLLGNRSATEQQSIPPDDQSIPAEFVPQVRDRVRMDLSVDGVATLGRAAEVLAPPNSGAFGGLLFATSPVLDGAVGLPPAPGPTGHWPTFPTAPAGTPGGVAGLDPAALVSATWSGPHDVILTFGAGTLPLGGHVRVYPQRFVAIDAITADQPSFIRADGSAALVDDDTSDLSILLVDPLALPAASNQPAGSVLTFDVVVNDRAGDQLFGANISVPIGNTVATPVADQFATPDLLAVIPDNVRSIAPSPLFGLPSPPPAGGAPASIVDLLRRLASETTPRIGPRLPTMARFPTLLMVATDDNGTRRWDALVTGGRWARETRSARPSDGNPGGPAGPDVSASGVRVDGAAAFDVAQIALRRAQPLLPLIAGGLGWIPFVGDPQWEPPTEPASDAAPAGQTAPRTSAVAVLRTVAVAAESPELTLPAIPMPAPDASVQNLVDNIADALSIPPPTVNIAREEEMVREIRREFHWSRFGARDAQWALRRAVRQARDLVFVASPQFAATAVPDAGGPAPHEVDLVAELATRMAEQPSLLVVVCVPRWPDAEPAFGGWVRSAFRTRNEATQALTDIDASRFVAFHPRGFPGRSVAIRTTTVVVDDAWMLSGTSHWRRRGMTFDEGVDVVGFDRQTDGGGASTRIRQHRRALMADLAGIRAGEPEFVRLHGTRSSVDVVADLVGQGGLGRLAPFWAGPTDNDVVEQAISVADPDGGTSDDYLALFGGLVGESP